MQANICLSIFAPYKIELKINSIKLLTMMIVDTRKTIELGKNAD
jgi:hypothetical protein